MPPKKRNAPAPAKTNSAVTQTSSSKLAKMSCCVCCQQIDTTKDEALFCSGSCQHWLHRYCAGVSTNAYTAFKVPGISFHCFGCHQLLNQEEAKKLASTVQQLNDEVLRLKTALRSANQSPPKDATCSDMSRKSYATATVISNGESGHVSASTVPNVQVQTGITETPPKINPERKFNIVVYGINECSKGTPRHSRLQSDLSSAVSILSKLDNNIQPQSIKDCYRLGKFLPERESPRPILVKLIRISDVYSVLSKRSNLSRPLNIKPDLTKEERLCESSLMKERWRLIQSGVSRGDIKVRGPHLYVRGKVHGHYRNSVFQYVSTQSTPPNVTQPLISSDNASSPEGDPHSQSIVPSCVSRSVCQPPTTILTPSTDSTNSNVPLTSPHHDGSQLNLSNISMDKNADSPTTD